jgi:UrcA family protein
LDFGPAGASLVEHALKRARFRRKRLGVPIDHPAKEFDMAHVSFPARGLFATLMCGALTVLSQTASAQNTMTGPPPKPGGQPVGSSTESIEVFAPRLKVERQPINGTLQKVSLEGPVRYDDLNLRTDEGVAEFRSRITQEAADICARLAQVYPVYAAVGTSCVKDAIEDATIRANRVITQAREPTY